MTVDAMVAEAMTTATQVPEELACLLNDVAQLKPKSFLEIGSDRGGTFRALGRLCGVGGIKISLDLPRFGLWPGFDFGQLHREMVTWFPNVHLVHGDSHAGASLARVLEILGDEKLDIVFIDGDHSYEGVKRDFQMYSNLVGPGGVVAFHDIVDSPRHRQQGCRVAEFWQELVGEKREYVRDGHWGGIGIWPVPLGADRSGAAIYSKRHVAPGSPGAY